MTKCRTFVNDTSILFSILRAQQYTSAIWVKEVMPTIVKVFVDYDLLAVAFNLIEFTKTTNNIDGTVLVCVT